MEKVTVIIPCKWGHKNLVSESIDSVASGTILPDQLIVFISPGENRDDIDLLFKKHVDKFPLFTIMQTEKTKNYAQAKNSMVEKVNEGIVISLDADDIQHPKRIEIIKDLFEKRDIVHLNHSFVYYDKDWKNVEGYFEEWESQRLIDSLKANRDSCGDFGAYGHPFCKRTQDGAMAFKREVFNEVKWDESLNKGSDKKLCFDILQKFNKSLLVDIPLVKWRKKN